jgi:spermidine synthase
MTTLELTATDDQAVLADRHAGWTRPLGALFFFSAFPALIYQLTWQRALFGVWGGGIESATIVIATFMLGLALGSLAGGWLSKRPGIPLLPLLAAVELISGAGAVAFLQLFDSVGDRASGWPPLATAATALALVIISALPLGALPPLRVGALARRSGHMGSAVGFLHCVIALGSGAACLGCLLLFRFVGMAGAVYGAATISAALAAGALAVHWGGHRGPAIEPALAPASLSASRKTMLRPVPLLGLAAAGGFVALSYQVFFLGAVSSATGSVWIAFATTSGAFLIGLAAGARRAGDTCVALTRDGVMRRAVGALMKASLLALLFLPLLRHLAWLDHGVIGVAFLMVYLVARFWGALLPSLAELGIAADRHAGMRTCHLYHASSLGAAAGALVTGLVLMDRLGLVATGAVLVVAGLTFVVLLIGAVRMPRSEKILRVSLAVTLGLLALVAMPGWSADVLERLQAIGAPHVERVGPAADNPSR